MSIYNLGRVVPIFKGDYNNNNEYKYLDVVLYNGSSYVVVKDSTTGNLPTDTEYWAMVAQAGTLSPEQIADIEQQIIEYVQSQGYVIDSNYVHTDNNFTTADKNKLEGIDMTTKQDTLISGTNIKTINNESLLGSGNIDIEGVSDYNELSNKPSINGTTLVGDTTITIPTKTSDLINDSGFATTSDVNSAVSGKQDTLVSGTNIKTVNNESLLGSGNITIESTNHFKGWFDNLTSLQTNYSSPVIGDYGYVKGATTTDPVKIYECTTVGTWSDSGREVDTSNVQSFESGESVNSVSIINDLTTGGEHDVLSAEMGKDLADELIPPPIYISSSSVYINDVSELYFIIRDNNITRITLRSYNSRVYARLHNNNTTICTCIFDSATLINNYIYSLVVSSTNDNTNYPIGTLIGYVVFKDITHFRENPINSNYENINKERAESLKFNPVIKSFLGIGVIDGLNSDSNISALSANQGRLLNNMINPKVYKEDSFNYYKDDILEVYSLINFSNNLSVQCKCYNNNLHYRLITQTSPILIIGWTASINISEWENNVIYPLIISSSTTEGINIGDTVGYVIFKNIEHFRNTYDASAAMSMLNVDRLCNLSFNPQINASLLFNQNIPTYFDGVSVNLPSTIYITKGDNLQLFFRDCVECFNPYVFDIIAVCDVGRSYPRYYQFNPTEDNVDQEYQLTIYVRDNEHRTIASGSTTIKCIDIISSPSSMKNILVVGASATANGNISYELNRRLNTNTGVSGNNSNPLGLNLNNISFVGRKITTQGIHQDATPGWSWKDYATDGRKAYRFFANYTQLHVGDVYSGDGTLKFTIDEINSTEGYFSCSYNGTGTQPASGTLTRYSGTGDLSISYSSYSIDSLNPFWNTTTQQLDFISYANEYCCEAGQSTGHIDLLVFHLGINDFKFGVSTTRDHIKTFISAYHSQFPTGKVIISTLPLPSPYGGMTTNYGASDGLSYWSQAKISWEFARMYNELLTDTYTEGGETLPYSTYLDISTSFHEFDSEHLYPSTSMTVCNRSNETEIIQTNGYHPREIGGYTVADSIYHTINKVLSE